MDIQLQCMKQILKNNSYNNNQNIILRQKDLVKMKANVILIINLLYHLNNGFINQNYKPVMVKRLQ